MVGTAIVLQALELSMWAGLWQKLKADATRQILIHGRVQPQRIPIIDKKLKQMAGHPTLFEQKSAERITKFIRRVTNTQAFEHLVTGLCNHNSPIRRYIEKPAIVKVL